MSFRTWSLHCCWVPSPVPYQRNMACGGKREIRAPGSLEGDPSLLHRDRSLLVLTPCPHGSGSLACASWPAWTSSGCDSVPVGHFACVTTCSDPFTATGSQEAWSCAVLGSCPVALGRALCNDLGFSKIRGDRFDMVSLPHCSEGVVQPDQVRGCGYFSLSLVPPGNWG